MAEPDAGAVDVADEADLDGEGGADDDPPRDASGDTGEGSDFGRDTGESGDTDGDAGDLGGDDVDTQPDAADADIDADDARDAEETGPDGGDGYDPSGDGPFEVVVETGQVVRDGRTIPVSVHGPRDQVQRPVVVLLPGFQLESRRYVALADFVASHGFIVVRADPPGGLFDASHTAMADDVSAVIDWLVSELGERIDTAAITAAGHSMGGKLSFMVAHRDPRVRAVFAIDPVNAGSPFGYSPTLPDIVPDEVEGLAIPIGVVGETLDAAADFGPACAPEGMNYVTLTDAAVAATWLTEWTFTGAAHMDFVADKTGCGFVCSACRDGDADEEVVRAGVATLLVAFLRLQFGADTSMDAWLRGDALPSGVVVRVP